MVKQKLQYIYKVVPDIDEVEHSNSVGRWYSERRKNYIHKLLYNHNFDGEYVNECEHLMGISNKIPENTLVEIRIKSPKIVFEFVECKDTNLESITNKLKEAANLAIDYNQFDILIDINMLLRKIDKTATI